MKMTKVRITYSGPDEPHTMTSSIDDDRVKVYDVVTIAQKEFIAEAGFVRASGTIWQRRFKTEKEMLAIIKTIAKEVIFLDEWVPEAAAEHGIEAEAGRFDPANPNYIIIR